MRPEMSRREALQRAATTVGVGSIAGGMLAPRFVRAAENSPPAPGSLPFKFCLNTSTIRGQGLPLMREVELIGRVGYDAVEPWLNEITKHQQEGGSLADLRKAIADCGLTVESAIGFAAWIVDDADARAQGLEQLKRDMDLVAQIGGTRIALPPVGATDQSGFDLFKVAQRYHAALELGRQMGVVPQLELWGFSKTLSRLGELMFVAVESGHPDACLLLDVYHIYKGGSDFTGLRLIDGNAIHVLHMNDYPGTIPRDKISDADRVYPGDGVAPLGSILQHLVNAGFSGVLSLELFNRAYWQQDSEVVLKEGLQKMRAAAAGIKA